MGVIAKFQCVSVNRVGGGHWEKCDEGDEGAVSVDSKESPIGNLYTDPPGWLKGAQFVRQVRGTNSVAVTLSAVSQKAGTDPDETNAQWAMASPSGQLTMTIANPDAFDSIKEGREYTITITEVRPKRSNSRVLVVEMRDGAVVEHRSMVFYGSAVVDSLRRLVVTAQSGNQRVFLPDEWAVFASATGIVWSEACDLGSIAREELEQRIRQSES